MIPQFNLYLALLEKIFFVLGAAIYLGFALIVVKQTTTMAKSVYDKFNSVLIAFAYVHLAFSVVLVLMTLVVL